MPTIIAIANQKGGVGKTTTAINLAAALALSGRTVVMIDLDPQANATSGVGVDLHAEDRAHPLLADAGSPVTLAPTDTPGLTVVPSSPALMNVEQTLGKHADGASRLSRCLKTADIKADFIVIDCPPSLGLLTANALNAANRILIPIQCEYYAMEGLTRILDALEHVANTTNRSLELGGIMLTMFDPDLELSHEVATEVRRYFPGQVYHSVIPRDVALGEAPSFGQPIFSYAPRATAALAYLQLAKEVISDE